MRKLVLSLILFLLIGVVVSVGLAWGAALWAPLGPEIETETDLVRTGHWPRTIYLSSKCGFATKFEMETQMDLRERREGAWGGPISIGIPMFSSQSGWPWPCMSTSSLLPGLIVLERWRAPDIVWKGTWSPIVRPQPRAVPTTIQWRGLAANVAVIGVSPWLVWRGCIAGSRWRRLARGHCGECGYEVRELPRCPECGAVSRKASKSAPVTG